MATCKKNTQYKSSCFICLIVGFVLSLLMSSVGAVEKITYYHNDALGSPVAATDEAGNLLWREVYQPYGERLLKQGDATNSTWFTGKQEDKASGLSYFHARWYDPVVGRFTAIDPVDFQEDIIHSFNRYAYANNNPYKFVDPDGNASILAGNMRGMTLREATSVGAPGRTAIKAVGVTTAIVAGTAVSGLSAEAFFATQVGKITASSGGLIVGGTGGEKADTLKPGPFAKGSIPARGPGRNFTKSERDKINAMGKDNGCHTCGVKEAGTKSGNFIPDHQPANALNTSGGSQKLYPHCMGCSQRQAGQVTQAKRRMSN